MRGWLYVKGYKRLLVHSILHEKSKEWDFMHSICWDQYYLQCIWPEASTTEVWILSLRREGKDCRRARCLQQTTIYRFKIILFVHFYRLFQVEYAIEAVKLGSTVVGIQTKQGSILAIEKRLTSTLLEPSSVEKVMEVDTHIGAAVSGLIGGKSNMYSLFFAFEKLDYNVYFTIWP